MAEIAAGKGPGATPFFLNTKKRAAAAAVYGSDMTTVEKLSAHLKRWPRTKPRRAGRESPQQVATPS